MPELRFIIRWPDGSRADCYSPSTIVREYFSEGTSYPLPIFLEHARAALHAASDRVRQRYGAPCSLASNQLAQIEAEASRFAGQEDVHVVFETFQQ